LKFVFWLYLLVIAAGIALYSAIGLAHL
jgi:hypothetical protein